MSTLNACLLLSWSLFASGLIILLTRRNILTLLFAILLMFNGTSLAWVASMRFHQQSGDWIGLAALLVVTAAQFLVGLGILRRIIRSQGSADISNYHYFKN